MFPQHSTFDVSRHGVIGRSSFTFQPPSFQAFHSTLDVRCPAVLAPVAAGRRSSFTFKLPGFPASKLPGFQASQPPSFIAGYRLRQSACACLAIAFSEGGSVYPVKCEAYLSGAAKRNNSKLFISPFLHKSKKAVSSTYQRGQYQERRTVHGTNK